MANGSDAEAGKGLALAGLANVDRRRFLQALAALGASIALPGAIEAAAPEAVEAAWKKALSDPWYFEISEWGSIIEPGFSDPKVRSDVFDLWDPRPCSPDQLIREIENFPPLQSAFERRVEDALAELGSEIDALPERSRRRARLERLFEEFSDPDEGWQAWIRHGGTDEVDEHWAFIQLWLDAPVDWSECDWFPLDWHGQGHAYRFFRDMDLEVLSALGVVIVEGDHPGNDYFAAELRSDIDEANAKAAELRLPFRFRQEEVQS
jgi:hypothetical protein